MSLMLLFLSILSSKDRERFCVFTCFLQDREPSPVFPFCGIAYDYTNPQDNEPEIATISIDSIEFREDEIKSIEVIE